MLDKQELVEYINKVIDNYKPEQEVSLGEFIYASIDHVIEEYGEKRFYEGCRAEN